jgi:hypothetical protein
MEKVINMVKSGFILQGVVTLAGLGFLWYLISQEEV